MIEKGKMINDRYEIIKNIGEGGMANVYLAYDTILDRRVAIKVLRGDLSNDEKFVRRFQREALSASSLSHPNIVEMYDVGEDNGIYYIVMEYIDGITLKQLIKKRGGLTLSEAIDIMLQITDGISQAHDSYIIHRDLKPQNIMIKEDGSIKITDFGIAMALNSTQLTQTNSVMGSVHYLPPEQASGKGSTIRSDIYSMGILFYEILTGNLPFKGDNAVEIALKQMRDEIPSVRKKNPAIPQSVENVILKSTAKNPKNRYADSKEMHADLLTVLNDERMDEEKIVFKYPEHEIEENTKAMSVVRKKTDEKLKNDDEKKEQVAVSVPTEDKMIKKTNKIIWILSSVFTVLVIMLLSIFLIIPQFTKIPDIKVPSVKGLTVIEAEEILKKAGFEVKVETVKKENDKVEKGKIIETEPQEGRSIKKGTMITLYESLGKETYTVEDYTGENYIEISTILREKYELDVKIETKDLEPNTDYIKDAIIEQSVPKGTVLGKGDKIILYIPSDVSYYPDFVGEGWTLSDVEKFCENNNIILSKPIEYVETTEVKEGVIIYSDRTPKDPVISKGDTRLTVKVAKAPSLDVTDPPSGSSDNDNKEDNETTPSDNESNQ